MPIMEIREVLTGKMIANDDVNEPMMMQKRINLPHGKRFKILSVECFDDNMHISASNTENVAVTREAYVTPFPIVPTSQAFGFTEDQREASDYPLGGMGAFAADSGVLYKRLDWTRGDFNDSTGNPSLGSYNFYNLEFPNPETANNSPFSWYTPHIYLTCKVNYQGSKKNTPIALSFYIKYEMTNADTTQCAMGLYKEQLEAQCRLLTKTANTIDVNTAAGRSFPMWKFGGARPEIMVTSANVLRYFNKLASQAYQDMDNIQSFRTRFKEATTMVGYDQPFGDTSTGIPDWITLMDVAGVTSGPIRSYPPPVKFSGNGNTVMYDTAGLPATVVT